MQKKISLIHNGLSVGEVETTRQPHVGARFDDVQPGKIFRIAGWFSDDVAKVELVPEEVYSTSGNQAKIV